MDVASQMCTNRIPVMFPWTVHNIVKTESPRDDTPDHKTDIGVPKALHIKTEAEYKGYENHSEPSKKMFLHTFPTDEVLNTELTQVKGEVQDVEMKISPLKDRSELPMETELDFDAHNDGPSQEDVLRSASNGFGILESYRTKEVLGNGSQISAVEVSPSLKNGEHSERSTEATNLTRQIKQEGTDISQDHERGECTYGHNEVLAGTNIVGDIIRTSRPKKESGEESWIKSELDQNESQTVKITSDRGEVISIDHEDPAHVELLVHYNRSGNLSDTVSGENSEDRHYRDKEEHLDRAFVNGRSLTFIPEEIISAASKRQGHKSKKAHRCGTCAKTFRSKSSLESHVITHTGEKPHQCQICGLRVRRNLNEHIHNVHSSKAQQKVECHICSAVIGKKNIGRHVRNHTIEKLHTAGKVHECSTCGKSYKHKGDLTRHEKIHQKGQSDYKCDQCGQTFTQSYSLNIHMRKHRGEKPFECEICGNRYHRKDLLTNHARMHSGEARSKRFECDTCDAGFFLRSQLLNHATVHNGAGLYKCHICDKAYTRRGSLVTHMKRHTEIFECHVCEKVLAGKSCLKTHLKLKHGELEEHLADINYGF